MASSYTTNDLANKLFFLLDVSDGWMDETRLPGFRSPKDRTFAESLGKWFVERGHRWTPKQSAALLGFLKRYTWQLERMPDDYDVETSQVYMEWETEAEMKRETKQEADKMCLITDD